MLDFSIIGEKINNNYANPYKFFLTRYKDDEGKLWSSFEILYERVISKEAPENMTFSNNAEKKAHSNDEIKSMCKSEAVKTVLRNRQVYTISVNFDCITKRTDKNNYTFGNEKEFVEVAQDIIGKVAE